MTTDPTPGATDRRPSEVPETRATSGAKAPRTAETTRAGRGETNMTGWLSLVVAFVLAGLQIFYSLNANSIDGGALEGYRSVITFATLVLGLAGAVLALVGLAQRRRPRWPSVAGLSVGIYAFAIAVASWIGGLMDAGA